VVTTEEEIANAIKLFSNPTTGIVPYNPDAVSQTGGYENGIVPADILPIDTRKWGGKFAIRTSWQTVQYQNLQVRFYAGDAEGAGAIVDDMHNKAGAEEEWKIIKRELIGSVTAHPPVPGGQAGYAFSQWAERVMTPEEWNRVNKAQENYINASVDAGILPVQSEHNSCDRI